MQWLPKEPEVTNVSVDQETTNRVADELKSLIIRVLHLDIAPSAIKSETSPFDLGADSMTVVDLFLAMEDQFGVKLHDDELTPDVLSSFGKMLAFIENKITKL